MNETQGKITIGKLDAARHQLETAIKLYFAYGDPVSIHNLVGAAYNVIRDINEKRGGEMMLKDMWKLLGTEDARLFRENINNAENFLKHADRDPDTLLDLNPQWTEAPLFDAPRQYCALTEEQPLLLQLFMDWFVIRHPNMFCDTPALDEVLKKIDLDAFPIDRREFFESFWRFAAGRQVP